MATNSIVGAINASVMTCLVLATLSMWPARAQEISPALYEGPDRTARLIAGAKREGSLNLYGSMAEKDLRRLVSEFERRYGIKVNVWRSGKNRVLQRVVTEARANRFEVDFIHNPSPEMEALHREKLLQEVRSPLIGNLMAGAVPAHREWVGARIYIFVQAYNTTKVKPEELPRTFKDLLDPRWKGRIAVESKAEEWFYTVVREMGDEAGLKLFRDLVATNGVSVRSGNALLNNLVVAGEVPLALAIYSYLPEQSRRAGAPINWIALQPTVAYTDGVAVARRAPHPHAAVLFYDFMFSEGQAFLEELDHVTTQRKNEPYLAKFKPKFIDVGAVLDGYEKWGKIYEDTIQGRATDARTPAAAPAAAEEELMTGGSSAALARGPALWQRIDLKWVAIGVSVAIVAYLALVPLVFLLWQSFFTPQTATKAAEFTLDNYVQAYSSLETVRLFINSLQFATGTAIFAFLVGTLLAWMNERTNTPFKALFFALSIIPLVIPGILFTVSWILLGSPKIGIINLVLQNWFGTERVFVNVYSVWGMIWVEGLHYSPMAFLLMTAAFRSMDPAMEESAMMSGANIFQVAWQITLKLTWPAIFATMLILFVRALESFEVPALLGLPVGIEVFTSSIYRAIHQYPSKIGLASSYAVTLLLITSVGVYFQSRLSSQGNRYSTMTGKGFRPRTIDLGAWRYLAAAVFCVYFLLIVALPFLVLLWSSFQKFYSVPSMAALQNLTLDAYRFIFSYPTLARSVWNSLLLALGSATVIMLVTSVICWIVVKTKLPGRWLLDNLASLPMVFPGLVLGLSIMIFYLTFDIGIYGTIWIMFAAYVTRFLPYGLRYNTTSMLQIHKELEESAEMSGASWATSFRRIILPLLKPGLVAGWIYVVIVSIRELAASILLYSPGTEVVSIVIWELWENGQYVELSALGVLFIIALFILVMLAQYAGKKFGIKEA